VALDGPGFFSVQLGDRVLYTRDGRFTVTPEGQLVAVSDGAAVLGRGGIPIYLNPRGDLDNIQVDEDGRVIQENRRVGQLELVDFTDYDVLTKVGAQRFAAPEKTGVASPALVQHRYLETSGAEALPELVSMMEASRAYQINAQMVTLQDQSIGRLISAVLRV
jgi:flagellar basal body rod protein FlgG